MCLNVGGTTVERQNWRRSKWSGNNRTLCCLLFFFHNYVFFYIFWNTCRMHRGCYHTDQSSQCCQRAIFEVSLRLIDALGQLVVLTWLGEAAGARTAKVRAAFPWGIQWNQAEGEVASIEILVFFQGMVHVQSTAWDSPDHSQGLQAWPNQA